MSKYMSFRFHKFSPSISNTTNLWKWPTLKRFCCSLYQLPLCCCGMSKFHSRAMCSDSKSTTVAFLLHWQSNVQCMILIKNISIFCSTRCGNLANSRWPCVTLTQPSVWNAKHCWKGKILQTTELCRTNCDQVRILNSVLILYLADLITI